MHLKTKEPNEGLLLSVLNQTIRFDEENLLSAIMSPSYILLHKKPPLSRGGGGFAV
jgi:hypothetical protein